MSSSAVGDDMDSLATSSLGMNDEDEFDDLNIADDADGDHNSNNHNAGCSKANNSDESTSAPDRWEQRWVSWARLIIVLVLALTAAFLGISTYRLVSNKEQDTVNTQVCLLATIIMIIDNNTYHIFSHVHSCLLLVPIVRSGIIPPNNLLPKYSHNPIVISKLYQF